MAQSYQDAYNSLGSVYDPQTTLVNQQLAALPGQEQIQTSALDQAKVNAFKDIDNSANSKGVLFSGFSPDQQASYLGTKYLPALAGIKSQTQQNQFKLQAALNGINADRSKQAQDSVAAQQKQESDDAYKQAQLQLSYARLGASSGNAAASAAAKAAAQYKVSQKANGAGYSFTGANGQPVSLAQFIQGTGKDVNDLLDYLKNGSTYDQAMYKQAVSNANAYGGGASGALQAIAAEDTHNYYGLR